MKGVPERRESVPARYVAAVVVGNALEFYDFLTFSFFAVYIGRTFFPSSDPSASLLASLATFGAGFVTRPIGAFVIGRMGDRLGRKPAMILSFWLMGVAITGLALTPPRAMIGVTAPVLVVFFRMLQGFALGGEVGPTTAFLLEVAPPGRRGFYTSFQSWTQDAAVLVSGLVGFGLANMLTDQQLQDFGWRIAFLAGVVIVPFGLALRRRLPETFHAARDGKRERVALRPYLPIAVIGLLLLGSATIGAYILDYMTTYAITTLHMPANVAFAATVVVGLCGVFLDLVGGVLSDRFGRKAATLVPGALLLVSILPAFYAILHYRSTAALLGVTAVLASLGTLFGTPMIVWITESLPTAIRSGSVAVIYAVAISAFGGTTQYAVTWLMKATGSPLAPAWYWSGALAVGLTAMCVARESAPRKIAVPNELPASELEVS
jgi:MHS family citrate/tricarballylate:H+ symporter-like MFS transporter